MYYVINQTDSTNMLTQNNVDGVLALSRTERSTTFDLRSHIDAAALRAAVIRKLGLKFAERAPQTCDETIVEDDDDLYVCVVCCCLLVDDVVNSLPYRYSRGSSASMSFVARLASVSGSAKLERRAMRQRTSSASPRSMLATANTTTTTTTPVIDEASMLRSAVGGGVLVHDANDDELDVEVVQHDDEDDDNNNDDDDDVEHVRIVRPQSAPARSRDKDNTDTSSQSPPPSTQSTSTDATSPSLGRRHRSYHHHHSEHCTFLLIHYRWHLSYQTIIHRFKY
jgi:hypothetical protein